MKLTSIPLALLLTAISLLAAKPGVANSTSAGTERPLLEIQALNLVGKTMQDVLLKLPPPASVYLAGSDAEVSHPSATDPIIFRYEIRLRIGEPRNAECFVTFDPADYEVAKVCAATTEMISTENLVDSLRGARFRLEKRRTRRDDFDIWITDEVDPEGDATIIIFPDLGLKVSHIKDMPSTILCFR